MEQHMTPDRIANAILQDTTYKGCYLIVEGTKDSKFYSKFINNEAVRIREGFGNSNVKEIIKELDHRKYNKKIAVVDSDFNHVLGFKEENNIFFTDAHDIEVMMLNSNALNDIINQYCKKETTDLFIEKKGNSIKELLFKVASEIGMLRLANHIHDLGVKFKPTDVDGVQVKFRNFIDEKTFNITSAENLINTYVNYSRGKSPALSSTEKIVQKFNEIKKDAYELTHIVNGHDCTNLLYVLIKKTLKSNNKSLNDFCCLEDSLTLAYDSTDFIKTDLFKKLKNWAENNKIIFFNEKIA